MEASGLDFRSVFGLLRAGSVPSLSSEDVASRISACVQTVTNTEDTCLSLSLIESIISRLTAHSFTEDATVYYQDVIRRLFSEINLTAKLVSLLSCQDQLVSHLSAKCMSVYIINELCIAGMSSCMWTDACAAVFERSVSGSELDSCLWSVTAVIKGVLKADTRQNKREVLTRLLSALDFSITHLYRNLLALDTQNPHSTDMRSVCKSMSEFIELLEALNAARLRHGLSSSSQRLSFTLCSSLLYVIRADVEYVVKKRVLLLLKKSVLRRTGDDWALGDVQSASGEDLSLAEDLLNMADTVLLEVNAGWLKEVPVKAQASFFGGNCDGTMKKDDVTLRAVSLILLKSLEIKTQSPHQKGSAGEIDVARYLTELMLFLQHHVSLDSHRCCWVSALFAEQDDDMMEAINTLMALYLYQKRSCPDSGVCVWGFNPHCLFILLLRSLSFDHSVLLDFLISSETCFLEYCVRYLKLLRQDWAGLRRSSRHIEDCDGDAKRGSDLSIPAPSAAAVPCGESATGNQVEAALVSRLVDYGSSDESEEADAVDCGASVMLVEESLLGKVFACLMDLRTAVTRLHNRGLFPYNPSSLLKLLNGVESQRNMLR